jgi:hypothetical protein
MTTHFQDKEGGREDGTDEEAPGHILEFRICAFDFRYACRLERHAAEGTIAWCISTDLAMHRAGIDPSRG